MANRSKKRKAAPGSQIPTKGAGAVAQGLPYWLSRDWLWGLILVLAVILVYLPVWWAGYIWDDDVYITASPYISGLHGLKETWTTSAADISPLTFTTFWVEHALWGMTPLPYPVASKVLTPGG